MLLPIGYQNVEEYFQEAMHFLSKYRWVYCYPLTKLLVCNVFGYIPCEWHSVLENMSSDDLASLSSANSKEHWPRSLSRFLQKCRNLQFGKKSCVEDWKFSPKLQKGLSPKKHHEVSRLAALVHEECSQLSVKRILDIGSGLGYLDLVLHVELGYFVLGLESKASLVSSASQKAFSFCKFCDGVSFVHCEITSSVDVEMVDILEKRLFTAPTVCICNKTQEEGLKEKIGETDETTSSATCLVGLHPCGDLSAASANLFLELPQIQLMILIPCCYHKMELAEEQKEEQLLTTLDSFSYFPFSQTLRSLVQKNFLGYEEYLGRPFLRLASQESCVRWKNWTELEHKQRAENLMSRATLEHASHRLGIKLEKKHRRCVRKSQRNNFDTFLDDAVERYNFMLPDGTKAMSEEILIESKKLWVENSKLCGLAEAYTGLQAAMQACVETFILIDKMVYMQEQQDHQLSFDIVKVMDEDISPRCHGLVIRKLKKSS